VTDIHRFIAYSIPTGFIVLTLWAVVSLVRNRNPHDLFWSLLAALQIVIGVQVLVGGYLYLTGARPESNGPEWLHYVYGGLFPAAVLIAAHRIAASDRFRSIPWAVFGFAALVCFGLTFRALQTGLGID
jgi:heme A synthase